MGFCRKKKFSLILAVMVFGLFKLEYAYAQPQVSVSVKRRIDFRAMVPSEGGSSLEVMSAEIELTASVGEQIDVALQLPFYTAMEGRGKDMHFGNAYIVLKGEVKAPILKVGQFVVPFGNLTYYETHTRIIQSLYKYNLGVRIDTGVGVEGYIGDGEYTVSVTNGNGPYRRDEDNNKVIAARISRRFELGNDELSLGLSGLSGRLPAFGVTSDPLMEPDAPFMWVDKRRMGLDLEYYKGIELIRAELIVGEDDGRGVNGQWLQFNHPLSYKTELEMVVERWAVPNGRIYGFAIGASYKLQELCILRIAYEDHKCNDQSGIKESIKMLTGQVLVEF